MWDKQEKVSQRIAKDPMGLGRMQRDKLVELAYTRKDASQDAQKGMSLQTRLHSTATRWLSEQMGSQRIALLTWHHLMLHSEMLSNALLCKE